MSSEFFKRSFVVAALLITSATGAGAESPARLICPEYRELLTTLPYPADARRCGLEGEVAVQFTVLKSGRTQDMVILSSTNRLFNRPALQAVSRLSCPPQERDIRASVTLRFKIAEGAPDQSEARACLDNVPPPRIEP